MSNPILILISTVTQWLNRVLKKINTKLNFWWSQSNCLSYLSRRLLCNALIQSDFDYGCTPWYPLLSKTITTKLQLAQNKYIRFCLELPLAVIWTHPILEKKLASRWTQCRTMYFIIFVNSNKLKNVWKKITTFFKRRVSIILWSFSS